MIFDLSHTMSKNYFQKMYGDSFIEKYEYFCFIVNIYDKFFFCRFYYFSAICHQKVLDTFCVYCSINQTRKRCG